MEQSVRKGGITGIALIVALCAVALVGARAQSGWVQQGGARDGFYQRYVGCAFFDDTTGVMCAWQGGTTAFGTVRLSRTSDGGVTWHDSTIFGGEYPLQPRENVRYLSRTEIVVFGTISRVFYSSDAGAHWTRMPSSFCDVIAMPDTGHLVGIGSGTDSTWVLQSTDHGATWTTRAMLEAMFVSDLGFVDPTHGFAAGYGGVWKTTDGGSTWRALAPIPTGHPALQAFRSTTSGVVATDSNAFFATSDTGRTWRQAVAPAFGVLSALRFIDDSIAVALVDSGRILRSTDAGSTWSDVPCPTAYPLSGIFVAPGQDPALTGDRGVLLRTSDRGASWRVVSGLVEDFTSVAFADDSTEMLVGNLGVVVRTTDGGKRWQREFLKTRVNLRAVAFATSRVGVIAGDSGTIFRTTDAGITWRRQQTATTSALRALAIGGGTAWFAAGDSGIVLRSVDSGMTWTAMSIDTMRCTALAVRGDTLLAACASYGAVHASTIEMSVDGGAHWSVVLRVDSIQFVSLAAPSGNTALVTGWPQWKSDPNVARATASYVSTNGGTSWQSTRGTTYDCPAIRVAFADSIAGYGLIPWSGTARTTNGGRTWMQYGHVNVMVPYVEGWGTIAAVPGGHAVAAGVDGAVWHTDDYGGPVATRFSITPRFIDEGTVALYATIRDSVLVTNGDSVPLFVRGAAHSVTIAPYAAAYLPFQIEVEADTGDRIVMFPLAGNADLTDDTVSVVFRAEGALLVSSCTWFEFSVTHRWDTFSVPFTVWNRGNRVLVIDSAKTRGPKFSVAPSHAVIPVGDSQVFFLSYAGDTAAFDTDMLTMWSNAHEGIDSFPIEAWLQVDVREEGGSPAGWVLREIFPDPATTRLWAIINEPLGRHAMVTVVDALGREVRRIDVVGRGSDDRREIDVGALPSGVYVCTVRDMRGGVARRVFAVRR